MVKESERKKPYRPRVPHKEGCACAPCKAKRSKQPSPPMLVQRVVTELPPTVEKVRLDSLLVTAKFVLGGQEHRVAQKVEGLVVCYNLAINDTATLGGSTLVEPI